MSRGTFCRNFSEDFHINFGSSSRSFRHPWEFLAALSKLESTFPGEHSEEKCFFQKPFLFNFGDLLILFSGAGTNVSGRLSKLHATCPKKPLQENFLKEFLFHLVRNFSQRFVVDWQNDLSRWSKPQSMCPKVILGIKIQL